MNPDRTIVQALVLFPGGVHFSEWSWWTLWGCDVSEAVDWAVPAVLHRLVLVIVLVSLLFLALHLRNLQGELRLWLESASLASLALARAATSAVALGPVALAADGVLIGW